MPSLGLVLEQDRGSLPFALVHGEPLVACAAWALGEAGVTLVDAGTPWSSLVVRRRAGRPARPALPAHAAGRSSRRASPRAADGRRVVVGVRPVTDTVKVVEDGYVGAHARPRRPAPGRVAGRAARRPWSRRSTACRPPTWPRWSAWLAAVRPGGDGRGAARRPAGSAAEDDLRLLEALTAAPPRRTSSGNVILRFAGCSGRRRPGPSRVALEASPRCRCPRTRRRPPRGTPRAAARPGRPGVSGRRPGRLAPPRRSEVTQARQRRGGQRAAVLAGGVEHRREQRRGGEGPGAVVDRDDVQVAGVDLGGQHLERLPLRVVPGRPAGHEQRLPRHRARARRRPGRPSPRRPGRPARPGVRRRRRAPRAPTRRGRGRHRAGAAPCWCPRPRGCPSRRRGSRRRRARPTVARTSARIHMVVTQRASRRNEAVPTFGSVTPSRHRRPRGVAAGVPGRRARGGAGRRRARARSGRGDLPVRRGHRLRAGQPRPVLAAVAAGARASSARATGCRSSPRRCTSTPSTCGPGQCLDDPHVSVAAYDVKVVEGVVLIGHRKTAPPSDRLALASGGSGVAAPASRCRAGRAGRDGRAGGAAGRSGAAGSCAPPVSGPTRAGTPARAARSSAGAASRRTAAGARRPWPRTASPRRASPRSARPRRAAASPRASAPSGCARCASWNRLRYSVSGTRTSSPARAIEDSQTVSEAKSSTSLDRSRPASRSARSRHSPRSATAAWWS